MVEHWGAGPPCLGQVAGTWGSETTRIAVSYTTFIVTPTNPPGLYLLFTQLSAFDFICRRQNFWTSIAKWSPPAIASRMFFLQKESVLCCGSGSCVVIPRSRCDDQCQVRAHKQGPKWCVYVFPYSNPCYKCAEFRRHNTNISKVILQMIVRIHKRKFKWRSQLHEHIHIQLFNNHPIIWVCQEPSESLGILSIFHMRYPC